MKNYLVQILVPVLFFLTLSPVFGNDKKQALGIRMGVVSPGAELSYQYQTQNKRRIEMGVGIAEYPIQLSLTYQRLGMLLTSDYKLITYGGIGTVCGLYTNKAGLGFSIQLGQEYNISASLHVFADYRPKVFLTGKPSLHHDLAAGIRIKY